jgi:hypothetical protein
MSKQPKRPAKAQKPQEPPVEAVPEKRATATPFRPEDPRLLDALEVYAARIRRSRNMAINLLLEDAMTKEGLWPPAESSTEK